jgi:hypothetical protein
VSLAALVATAAAAVAPTPEAPIVVDGKPIPRGYLRHRAGIAAPEEQQEALEAFVVEFRRKWSARTVCRKRWVAADCGRVVRRG